MQDGRNFARSASVIYRCVRSGKNPDPDPDVKEQQHSGSLWEIIIGSCCSENETVCSEGRFPRLLHYIDVQRHKPTPALMDFMKQSSMIIGILMERSHCLNFGSEWQVLNCSPKIQQKYICGFEDRLTKKQLTARFGHVCLEEWSKHVKKNSRLKPTHK